jgi:hypothetical protein
VVIKGLMDADLARLCQTIIHRSHPIQHLLAWFEGTLEPSSPARKMLLQGRWQSPAPTAIGIKNQDMMDTHERPAWPAPKFFYLASLHRQNQSDPPASPPKPDPPAPTDSA